MYYFYTFAKIGRYASCHNKMVSAYVFRPLNVKTEQPDINLSLPATNFKLFKKHDLH